MEVLFIFGAIVGAVALYYSLLLACLIIKNETRSIAPRKNNYKSFYNPKFPKAK